MTNAWFCPSCQKYHAPHVETCPGPSMKVGLPGYFGPGPNHPGYDPCANCKGACSKAACPKRPALSSYSGSYTAAPVHTSTTPVHT